MEELVSEGLPSSDGGLVNPVPSAPAEPRPGTWYKRPVSARLALRDLWHARELIITLAERDLRVRYKQAVLGFAWALFTPVMLMLVFTLVFTRFANVQTGGVPYPLFAFVGLIPWTFFSNSVTSGGMSLVSNMNIVNKIYCPREVFPAGTLGVALVDGVMSIFVLAALFLIEGFAPKIQSLYFPVFLPALFAFTFGVTLAVSCLLVYLRDLRHALPMLVQLGLFATPVAYGITVIAHTTTGAPDLLGLEPARACHRRNATHDPLRPEPTVGCARSRNGERHAHAGRRVLAVQTAREWDRRHCLTGRSPSRRSGSASGRMPDRSTCRMRSPAPSTA